MFLDSMFFPQSNTAELCSPRKRTATQQEVAVPAKKKQKTDERRLAEDDYQRQATSFLKAKKWVMKLFNDSEQNGAFGVVATEKELDIDTHIVIPVYARIEMTPENLEKVETHDLEQITKDIKTGKHKMYANAQACDFIALFDETCCTEDERKRSIEHDGYYENLER